MEYTIIILTGVILAIYFYERSHKFAKDREESEIRRFREFAIASKAKGAEDYLVALTPENPLRQESEHDEIVEIDSLDPHLVLKKIREDKENRVAEKLFNTD